MSEKEFKCVECGTQTKEAKDIIITPTIKGKKIVITGLTGSRCPNCGEQYVDAESLEKVEKVMIDVHSDKLKINDKTVIYRA